MLISLQRHQSGFMAIVLVVFLVVFVAIAAAIVSMTTSGARSAGDHVNAVNALFMAESGIEWAALKLFDSPDPESDCDNLENDAALPVSVNGQGSFDIQDSEVAGTGSCRLKVRGMYQQTTRVLTGSIPESILDGDAGGGDDLFDNPDDWQHGSGGNPSVYVSDGVLHLERQGSGQTKTRTTSNNFISDTFGPADTVYFVANVEADGDPTGNTLNLDVTLNGAPNPSCSGDMPLMTGACSAPPSDPLYDSFNTVWVLGDPIGVSSTDVEEVEIWVDWAFNDSDLVTIANGCIGRAAHCAGEGSSDPVDDGTWNEDP